MSVDFYKESLATYEEYEIESEKDEEEEIGRAHV